MCTEQDDSCGVEGEPSENPRFHHQKDVAFGTKSTPAYHSAQQTEDIRPSSVSRFKSMPFFLTVAKAMVIFWTFDVFVHLLVYFS